MKIYAVYKGDEFLYLGTKKECADYFGVKERTVHFWATPINKRRGEKNYNRKIAIVVEEE